MKTKIYKITFALLLPVIFYVIVSGFIKTKEGEIVSKSKISPPPVTTSKDFTNILLNTSYRNSPCVWDLENHLKQYQELNFNGIHMYDWGSDKFGQFIPALTTTQINNLNELIYRSDTSGLKTVFERTKITRLCYGQRLEYEVVQNTGDSVTNFGFCYKNRDSNVGSYQTDSGRTVLHSETNPTLESPNSAGWLCKDIYENMQHTDLYYFLQSADTADWFLKPMMRIRQTDFNVNSTTPVVAIISYNFRGYPIDTVVIRVNNFRNSSGNYEGNYTNSYTFLINNDSLIVKGSLDSNSTISGLNYGYGGNEGVNGFDRYNVKQCKVDFRVYWFGQVDVWFDKLTVDDRFANILFNPNTSLNYDSNIEDEVSHFGDSLDIFFADELVYSQLPCFKYVQDKLRTLNSGTKLSYAISNNLNHYSLRNEDNVFNYHLSETNPDIIQIDAHAFPVYDNQGAVPINAIQNYDSRIPQAWRATNDNYNNYLQKVLGYRGYYSDFPNEGSFIYQITTTHDQVAQMTTPAKFIVQPQIQHWMSADATGFKSGGNREPLNEEIQVQAGIAIAHGAESLSWFTFESDSTVSGSYNGACNASPNPYQRINFPVTLPVSPDYFIWFGLLNKYPDTTKRTKNIYGQDKWNYVKNLNKKILHWKPTLDKITWQDGYSVHSETADHYFISDIKSIRRNPSLEYDEDYPFTYYDATNERYWEMGFFNPDDASDKSKYFLMVNRRCVPDINNDGDVRGLRIKFDSTELAGFINWKIIELDTNNVVATFNKNTTSYINMGEFNPGEGKLYKLAPVMQEGGELVADESCFSSFNCKGEVYSEGFDIRLNPGTEISFSENGRLAMNGGSFISGYTESNQSNSPVILQGLSSQKWKGVSFNNCVEVNVINTSFSGISPEESGAVQLTNCLNTSIISSLFNSTDSVKTALSVDYILNGGEWNVSLYLKNNQFINTVNSLKVISYGSTVIPVTIDGNSFAASIMGYNAVTLSNIAAGIIKNNFLGNYRNSMNMICCTADLYRNVISCSYTGSVSISPSGMSCLNFGKSGDYYTGGINSMSRMMQT